MILNLGVTFNYTGTFVLNIKCIKSKALKAMFVLLNNVKKYEVQPQLAMQLFDSFVSSILNYGCPIWGFTKSKDLERIHLQFCKAILGVKQTTSNAAIYGELRRYPLYVARYVSILKYWFKLIHSENTLLHTVYIDALSSHLNGSNNWVTNVKRLLDEYGFTYAFENSHSININHFIKLFKNTVIDCFIQKWYSDVAANSTLSTLYMNLKVDFE